MTQVTSRPRRCMRAVAAVALLGSTACLGPSSNGPGLYSSYVLPPGSDVPDLESDDAASKKLDANDGLSGKMIPLHTAFSGGDPVEYWDLGTLTAVSAKPMWIFRRRGPETAALPVDHPNLIDSIPGDTAYTPLRQLYVVIVTDAYNGERITSLRALDDAVELGLVEAPQPQDNFVNCVVTLSSMQLVTSDDGTTDGPEPAYYRGKTVHQFCIGGFEDRVGAFALKNQQVIAGNAYLLRRQNQSQPLDEALLKTDLNGNMSMLDTNVVFDSKPGDAAYMSVWHSIDVVVPDDYTFGTSKSEMDLFDDSSGGLVGKPGQVIEYADSGVFLNRPIRAGTQVVP